MNDATPLFATLGHPDRLAVFRLLLRHAPQGVQPSHIAGVLGVKANKLSHHLSDLAQAGLVQVDRRGRALFYTVDLERVKSMLGYLVEDCCRGRADLCLPASPAPMTDGSRPLSVLFVCSGNSARSLMAEALLHHANPQRFRVHSAGTTPANAPHPMAIEVLKRAGIDITPCIPNRLPSFKRQRHRKWISFLPCVTLPRVRTAHLGKASPLPRIGACPNRQKRMETQLNRRLPLPGPLPC